MKVDRRRKMGSSRPLYFGVPFLRSFVVKHHLLPRTFQAIGNQNGRTKDKLKPSGVRYACSNVKLLRGSILSNTNMSLVMAKKDSLLVMSI